MLVCLLCYLAYPYRRTERHINSVPIHPEWQIIPRAPYTSLCSPPPLWYGCPHLINHCLHSLGPGCRLARRLTLATWQPRPRALGLARAVPAVRILSYML